MFGGATYGTVEFGGLRLLETPYVPAPLVVTITFAPTRIANGIAACSAVSTRTQALASPATTAAVNGPTTAALIDPTTTATLNP